MPLDVNTRLRTLRDEHFRHEQNLRRVAARNPSHNAPTVHEQQQKPTDSPSWRALALSIVFPQSPLLSLTLLCLRTLASTSDFASTVLPYLPPHLRRALLRDAAVHAPLPSSTLYALCEPHGHADGELIVVGPNATLRSGHFLKMRDEPSDSAHPARNRDRDDDSELSWDSPAQDEAAAPELHTVVILRCSVSTPTLLAFPPTLTHLALIDIPTPVPFHRLPGTCPLIVVLDLSHNRWASPASMEVQDMFHRVAWTRWNRLRILGLREWLIPKEILDRVNEGRWNDVEVVL